ncbi:MAG: hypothetical protein WAR83_04670 [Flavobacteriales bacterium]|nr:hypothetical protein [Flavobacteriales bacterium]
MILRSAYLYLFIVAPFLVSAQSAGKIRLLVDPGHNFKFVVDKQFKMEQREVELSEGLHHFSVWAPERMVVDTPVFVVADRTTDLVVRLPYSPEYEQYRNALSRYNSVRRSRVISTIVLAGGLVWTGFSYGKYASAKDQLDTDRKAYEELSTPGEISVLKDKTIPEHNDDLVKARTGLYVSAAITTVAAGAMAYFRLITKRGDRPVFDDMEKVRFEGLTWVPDAHGSFWMAGITIPINK